MIKVENIQVFGFEPALRGMRNPLDSWDKSDSGYKTDDEGDYRGYVVGDRDDRLARTLIREGAPNRKFLRHIQIYMDITAPLYWWKEFDTYKVGTVANSCSTMHRIHAKPLTLADFSHEHLTDDNRAALIMLIASMNEAREQFLMTKDKEAWWQMIQLLPTSYNQRRTVMFNYETAAQMVKWRKMHKQDEWRFLCEILLTLPHSEWIQAGAVA